MTGTRNYQDLGPVNSREMLKKALEEKYAVPAYNLLNQLMWIVFYQRSGWV